MPLPAYLIYLKYAVCTRQWLLLERGHEFATITADTSTESSLAGSSSAFIVYNRSTGSLFYNSDGAVAGLGSGGQFAVLNTKPLLDNSDFSLLITQITGGPQPPIPLG